MPRTEACNACSSGGTSWPSCVFVRVRLPLELSVELTRLSWGPDVWIGKAEGKHPEKVTMTWSWHQKGTDCSGHLVSPTSRRDPCSLWSFWVQAENSPHCCWLFPQAPSCYPRSLHSSWRPGRTLRLIQGRKLWEDEGVTGCQLVRGWRREGCRSGWVRGCWRGLPRLCGGSRGWSLPRLPVPSWSRLPMAHTGAVLCRGPPSMLVTCSMLFYTEFPGLGGWTVTITDIPTSYTL